MAIWTLPLLGAFFLTLGLYNIAVSVLALPSRGTITAFKQLFYKKTSKQMLQDKLVLPLAKLISKNIHLSEYKKRRLNSELNRAGIEKTPEQFISENLSNAIEVGAFGTVIGFLMGAPFIIFVFVMGAVVLYRNKTRALRDKITAMNKEIESELPRMVETLNYTLGDNNDLLKFFVRYWPLAGTAMRKALDRLIFNMKTGNTEEALRDFDRSLAIPQISTLVSTLLGITRGIDQRTSLLVLEKSFRTKQRELLRREIDRRPNKVKGAGALVMISMIVLMLVPLFIMIFQSFNNVGLL